jgi:hypothetical protein
MRFADKILLQSVEKKSQLRNLALNAILVFPQTYFEEAGKPNPNSSWSDFRSLS